MWEASEGIIAILAVMFIIGILAGPTRGKSRVRFHQDFKSGGQAAGSRFDAMASANKYAVDQAASGTTSPNAFASPENRISANVVNVAKEK